MLLFINWLTEQMNAVSALDQIEFAPEDANQHKTKKIRLMNLEEKKLYIVVTKLCREFDKLVKEREKLPIDQENRPCNCSDLCEEINSLETYIGVASSILTTSVRMSFKDNEDGSHHIRMTARNGEYWLEEIERSSYERALEEFTNLFKTTTSQKTKDPE
ncbi:MAG: hypothetical protein WC249_01910 [Patescibacteria group bacterium]